MSKRSNSKTTFKMQDAHWITEWYAVAFNRPLPAQWYVDKKCVPPVVDADTLPAWHPNYRRDTPPIKGRELTRLIKRLDI